MRTDTLIMHDGFKAIFDKLDIVEAERFIALMKRDNFDYTEWQRDLWKDMSVDSIYNNAKEFYEKNR